ARWACRGGVELGAATPPPPPAPAPNRACKHPLRAPRQQAGYYRALHRRATQREAKLKEQLAHCHADWAARLHHRETELQQRITDLEAEVRLLKQRLYGRSCEAHHAPTTLAHGPTATGAAAGVPAPPPRRRRAPAPPPPARPPHPRVPPTPGAAGLPPRPAPGPALGSAVPPLRRRPPPPRAGRGARPPPPPPYPPPPLPAHLHVRHPSR